MLEADEDADGIFQAVDRDMFVEPATMETRSRELPAWAGGKRNMLGIVPFSRCHYYGVVAINDVVVEAIMDTGGARSLVDVDTARQMGLEVKEGDAGYFWGPGNAATSYFGRVVGPVRLQFEDNLVLTLPELKVVKGTRKDPLLILGSDLMAPCQEGEWDFVDIGCHPTTKQGQMRFSNGSQVKTVPLACWPQPASRWVRADSEKSEKGDPPKKRVTWKDEKHPGKQLKGKKVERKETNLVALLRKRGQRV